MKRIPAIHIGIISLLILVHFNSSVIRAEEVIVQQVPLALLQKGFTLFEIDREISRLTTKQQGISISIDEVQIKLHEQQNNLEVVKQQIGKVLRSYYLGNRDSIWVLILSIRSFSDVLRTYDYLSLILTYDQRILEKYLSAQAVLQETYLELATYQEKLRLALLNYRNQRAEMLALQSELDREIAKQPNATYTSQQIQALNEEWRTKGIPLFEQYFAQLSLAFLAFPELLTSTNKDILSPMKQNKVTLTMTSEQFNEFLISQNKALQKMKFSFKPNQVVVEGQQDDIRLRITGNFQWFAASQMNGIRFTIQQLSFNDLLLPDTSIALISKQYPFEFYPKKMVSFFDVTEVKVVDNQLIAILKLSLK